MDLFERDEEVGQILKLLRGAAKGEGALLLVAGEAGAGKSALVRRTAENAPAGTRVLWGACDSLSTPRPLSPLLDLIANPSSGLSHVDTDTEKPQELFGAVLETLQDKTQTTMLIIEDIHWADDSSLDLLRYIGRRVDSTNALLICTYRDDEFRSDSRQRTLLGQLGRLESTHRIEVPGLTRAAVRQLADDSSIDGDALFDLTNGNAFFVTEVIGSGQAIPNSVQDAVLARLSTLDPDQRRVAETVALSPGGLEIKYLAALTGGTDADIDAALQAGVLTLDRSRLRFRHEIARLAAESNIAPVKRMRLHRSMISVLTDDGSQDLARLAHHAVCADDPELISEYGLRAARQASVRGAHKEAVSLFQTSLDRCPKLDLDLAAQARMDLAAELGIVDQHTDAGREVQRAVDYYRHSQQSRLLGNALMELSKAQWRLADSESAAFTLREGVEILRSHGTKQDLARAFYDLSYSEMLARHRLAALGAGADALELARELGADDLAYSSELILGCVELCTGQAVAGMTVLKSKIGVARERGETESLLFTLGMLGTGGGEARLYADAIPALEEAIALGGELDADYSVAYAQAWLARIAFEQGRWDEAVRLAEIPLSTAPAQSSITIATANSVIGRIRVRRGDPGGASLLAAVVSDTRFELQHEWPLVAGLAESAWLNGSGELADDLLRRAYDRALEADSPWARGELGFWMWKAGSISVPPADAAEPYSLQIAQNWRGAAEAWRAIGCPYETGLALADGDEPAMREALTLFEELGANPAARWLRGRMKEAGVEGVPRGPNQRTQSNPGGLTNRQAEVLDLISEGLSNAEIAERLVVSKKTVEHHVSAVFQKLGVSTRSKAIVAAKQLIPDKT